MSSEYFKDWYARQGKDWNKARRERYARDSAYRERIKEWNKTAREQSRVKNAEIRKEEREAKKLVLQTKPWKTVEVSEEETGIEVTMFSVGALAGVLGVSTQTIRLWERKGLIPRTPHRSSKGTKVGDRLYTAEMVEEIRDQMKSTGRLGTGRVRGRPVHRHRVCRVTYLDGQIREEPMFRIGVLAETVGRSVITLQQMEGRGALPETPFRATGVGYRLYTVPMIEAVKNAFNEFESASMEDRKKLTEVIREGWRRLGVLDAKVELIGRDK